MHAARRPLPCAGTNGGGHANGGSQSSRCLLASGRGAGNPGDPRTKRVLGEALAPVFMCSHLEAGAPRFVLQKRRAPASELRWVVGQDEVLVVTYFEPLRAKRRRHHGDAVGEGLEDLDTSASPEPDRYCTDVSARE